MSPETEPHRPPRKLQRRNIILSCAPKPTQDAVVHTYTKSPVSRALPQLRPAEGRKKADQSILRGKTRLAKWYAPYSDDEKIKLKGEVTSHPPPPPWRALFPL